METVHSFFNLTNKMQCLLHRLELSIEAEYRKCPIMVNKRIMTYYPCVGRTTKWLLNACMYICKRKSCTVYSVHILYTYTYKCVCFIMSLNKAYHKDSQTNRLLD